MQQVIYGDVLFLINFSMDFLSIYITSKFIHFRLKLLHVLFSASIGAFYGVASVFLEGNSIISLIISLAVSVLMCYISFGKKYLFKHTVIFYAVGLSLGGCMTALYSLAERFSGSSGLWQNLSSAEKVMSERLPVKITIPIAAVSVLFSLLFNRMFMSKKSERKETVKLSFENKSVTLSALVDSGNLLTEPISGAPVILTGYESISAIIPEPLRALLSTSEISELTSMPSSYARLVRLIPASTVGGDKLMVGFIPDEIIIDNIPKKACIAICGKAQGFGGTEALVPASLLE